MSLLFMCTSSLGKEFILYGPVYYLTAFENLAYMNVLFDMQNAFKSVTFTK